MISEPERHCVTCNQVATLKVFKGVFKDSPFNFYCDKDGLSYLSFPGFRVERLIEISKDTKKDASTNSFESSATSKVFDIPVDVTQTQVPNLKGAKPKKSRSSWVIIVASLLIIAALATWNQSVQTHRDAVAKLEARNNLAQTCFAIKEEDQAAKSGAVGTSQRQNAVVAFYDKVLKSPCVEWGDGSIFRNPYFKANQNSWNWQDLQNAFAYTLQRWNGVEPFALHCADGWNSPSIGRSGACSHHGGVTSGFNEFSKWNLINHMSLGEPLYGPKAELESSAS
jgi:hypothetical protein